MSDRERIRTLTELMMTNDDFLQYCDYVLSCYQHYVGGKYVQLPDRLLVASVKHYLCKRESARS